MLVPPLGVGEQDLCWRGGLTHRRPGILWGTWQGVWVQRGVVSEAGDSLLPCPGYRAGNSAGKNAQQQQVSF
jgi:hypothetical protein